MNNCPCNSEDTGFHGGDYKYAVSMSAEGFDMNTDDWVITVFGGCKAVRFTKENAIYDENEDQWYICINTDLLGVGQAYISFEAHVPDTDFEAGFRREKLTYELIFLNA